jgi:glycosyltransferase involved in cell wall biosynthesis
MKIGIAISTHNRKEVFKNSYNFWLKFLPKNAILIVVDDASSDPVKEANYRFETQVGIAKVKNKCIELLEQQGVTDYFLVDDDIYPITEDWYKPYIKSGLNHAMYIWDKLHNGGFINNKVVKITDNYIEYANPCGCLLYFKKICFDIVGGMDEAFGLWGYEHVQLSRRIFNAGLTPAKFLDVKGAFKKFYAHDYYLSTQRSLPAKVRMEHIKKNEGYFNKTILNSNYIPYRQMDNVIITTFFTGYIDPQKGQKWEANHDMLLPLIESLNGQHLIVIHDCFNSPNTESVSYVRAKCNENPYYFRWKAIRAYLKQAQHDFVFCCDATDVTMLKNPFEHMSGYNLYVGDEPDTLKNKWLTHHHDTELLRTFFKTNSQLPLLNAGLLGGKQDVVLAFLDGLVQVLHPEFAGYTDMGVFNYIAYLYFQDILSHGRHVNTIFKSYKPNNVSWFMHK